MTLWNVRKKALLVETIHHEGGPLRTPSLRKGLIAAVCNNPFADRFADAQELVSAMEALRPIALEMAEELCAALGGAKAIESFGKGSIVGSQGEIEHAALWHAPGGAAVRQALGQAKAQVPASKKIGHIGGVLDIPLHYIHASMVRSHYDVMPLSVPDAPKPNEIAFALVMSTGGRIHARIGGLTKEAASGQNGLT